MDNNLQAQVHDVKISLARMEGKLDASLEVKKDVRVLRDAQEKTDDIAKEALQIAKQNEKDISGINQMMKWGLGITFSVLTPVVLFILNRM
ncbi:hypothetical protein [Domibacillus aminovorans]|uniref:Holin n=1 Tax=Domibacillus aminovorans TaxID=29332 RepID=A0A177LBR9_9BACI|nr:hypothetical protein [Domibacillus aminovorans]OAH63260.1 hypothetical protein AWH49_06840 [Domibacillus aminovorans]